jgi:hypothetical protein
MNKEIWSRIFEPSLSLNLKSNRSIQNRNRVGIAAIGVIFALVWGCSTGAASDESSPDGIPRCHFPS